MNSVGEARLRDLIMEQLAQRMEASTVITRDDLENFEVEGEVHKLIDQSKGIRNPNYLQATITIISDPKSSYNDGMGADSLYRYAYEKGGEHGSNRKLRRAMELQLPIIMLRKIRTGAFVPIFPVYVQADDREHRQFLLALDEGLRFIDDPLHLTEDERRYADRMVRQRLHQPEFRAKVLLAYETQCAICRLRRSALLDAAHITSDTAALGIPVIANGLSLCKIHHAAYDADLLGISPEYRVHINGDLLLETDGPMLKHGLQEMDGRHLAIPRRRTDRPDPARLEARFAAFSQAG